MLDVVSFTPFPSAVFNMLADLFCGLCFTVLIPLLLVFYVLCIVYHLRSFQWTCATSPCSSPWPYLLEGREARAIEEDRIENQFPWDKEPEVAHILFSPTFRVR